MSEKIKLPKITVDWDDNGFFWVDGLCVGGVFRGSEGDLIGEQLTAVVLAANNYSQLVDALRDMIHVADLDSWHQATTGRQLVYAKAKDLLDKLDKL